MRLKQNLRAMQRLDSNIDLTKNCVVVNTSTASPPDKVQVPMDQRDVRKYRRGYKLCRKCLRPRRRKVRRTCRKVLKTRRQRTGERLSRLSRIAAAAGNLLPEKVLTTSKVTILPPPVYIDLTSD